LKQKRLYTQTWR